MTSPGSMLQVGMPPPTTTTTTTTSTTNVDDHDDDDHDDGRSRTTSLVPRPETSSKTPTTGALVAGGAVVAAGSPRSERCAGAAARSRERGYVPAPCGSHLKVRRATTSATETPGREHRDVGGVDPAARRRRRVRALQPFGQMREREDPPDVAQPVGRLATGMNTPETNARITVANGPIADAESAVVVMRVNAIPSAHIVALPSNTYSTNPPSASRCGWTS